LVRNTPFINQSEDSILIQGGINRENYWRREPGSAMSYGCNVNIKGVSSTGTRRCVNMNIA
jgi:hypothetical protein